MTLFSKGSPHNQINNIFPVSNVTLRMSTDTPTEGGEPEADPKIAEGERPEVSGEAALKLQHAIYTLTCIVWQQLTTIHR